jgi:hypothetical protein
MRALTLSASTQAILDRIRTYVWTLNVYGMSHSLAVRLVKARTEIRLNKAGITEPYSNFYRRCVLELVKIFRTRARENLAQAIPLVIRKWADLGLAVQLLEELLGDCFLRFEQQGYAMPRPKKLGEPARAHRRRRTTYERALKEGRVSLGGGNTVEEQAELQRQGSELASDIARRLKPVLQASGVTGRAIIPYFNFAQKLGRPTRKHGERTLQMAAEGLIDQRPR